MNFLPNFLIIGTMKSGTTSLSSNIGEHPEIFIPRDEIHFFNNEQNFAKGIKWYEKKFLKANRNMLIGEKTPTYCIKEKYASRIFNQFPNMKIIWIFRNPVYRTYSHYWHTKIMGEERKSFEESIKEEDEKLNKQIFYKAYLNRSIYSQQIKNFLKYFEKKQMHYVIFEEYIHNPDEILTDIFRFLNVDDAIKIKKKRKKNVRILPKSYFISKMMLKLGRFGKKIFPKHKIFSSIFQKLISMNNKKTTGYPKMNIETEKELFEYFREYNQDFARITCKNIEKWRK